MTRLGSQQWRMAARITTILGAGPGLTDDQLAEQLGVTSSELRPVVGMMLGRGLVQRCDSYLVPGVAKPERAQ
jgi:hypothetical protein